MGRLKHKPKSGRGQNAVKDTQNNVASSSARAPPTPAKLLAKAQALVEQCDYELAAKFAERILRPLCLSVSAFFSRKRSVM